jgi:hypothetical protein
MNDQRVVELLSRVRQQIQFYNDRQTAGEDPFFFVPRLVNNSVLKIDSDSGLYIWQMADRNNLKIVVGQNAVSMFVFLEGLAAELEAAGKTTNLRCVCS